MARLLWPVATIRLAQRDGALLVHLVVMDQHAARRFDHAHAFQRVHAGAGAHVRVEDRRIVQQQLHPLQRRAAVSIRRA